MHTTEKPLISVIVPVYNVGPYLTPCVDSLLGQTYQHIEVLLIDDGSTDGSGAVCDGYAARDPRVRVLHQKNQGVSAARNAGLDAAAGAYIAFVDADDYVAPDYLEVLQRDLETQKVDIVCCEIGKVDSNGVILNPGVFSLKGKRVISGNDDLLSIIAFRGIIFGALYRSSFMKDTRFENLRYGEDSLFVFNLTCLKPIVFLDDYIGYFYVQHEGSTMANATSFNMRLRKDYLTLASQRFLRTPDVSPNLRQECLERYASQIHKTAYAAARPENKAERRACHVLLKDHLRHVLPFKSQLPAKLRLCIVLYAKAPHIYDILVSILTLFRGRSRGNNRT